MTSDDFLKLQPGDKVKTIFPSYKYLHDLDGEVIEIKEFTAPDDSTYTNAKVRVWEADLKEYGEYWFAADELRHAPKSRTKPGAQPGLFNDQPERAA